MFERLDGARASSVVVPLFSLALVGGLLFEYAGVQPGAARLGAIAAGAIFACYAACATVYLLERDYHGLVG